MSKQTKKTEDAPFPGDTPTGTAVATANTTAVADVEEDDLLASMQGAGMEEVTAKELATPIVRILQANSPQCKRSDGAYVQGAEEGMLFNTLTGEVIDSNITVVPCFFTASEIEWKPDRGGLVAIHRADDPIANTITEKETAEGKIVRVLPNGNELVLTYQHFVLLVKDGKAVPVVIPMQGAQLKKSRQWNALMRQQQLMTSNGQPFTAPSFAYRYSLSTVPEAKDKYSWFGWKVELDGDAVTARASMDLVKAGKAFYDAIKSNAIKVHVDGLSSETASSSSTASAGLAADDSDDIPFN